VPIWAGSQDPCYTHGGTLFSSNTSTAYLQGGDEARSAVIQLNALGMSPSIAGNDEIAYDMEAFSGTPTCSLATGEAAAEAFIKGWDNYLEASPNVVAGVYGSCSGSNLSTFTGSPPPNFIWGACTAGGSNTAVMTNVPAGDWVNNQRLKQYVLNTSGNFGGVALSPIDIDNADGPIYYQ